MESTGSLIINFEHEGLEQSITVTQFDTGKKVRCYIAGISGNIGAAMVYCKKPSGLETYTDADIVDDHTVEFYITDQMNAETGCAKCQLQLFGEDKSLTSYKFKILVRENMIASSRVKSADDYPAFRDAIEKFTGMTADLSNELKEEKELRETEHASMKAQCEEAVSTEKTERQSADATEKSERQAADAAEKSERMQEIAVERARINNLITNNNPTEGNSELIDIRVGADGHTYETAGDAVRASGNLIFKSRKSISTKIYIQNPEVSTGSLNVIGDCIFDMTFKRGDKGYVYGVLGNLGEYSYIKGKMLLYSIKNLSDSDIGGLDLIVSNTNDWNPASTNFIFNIKYIETGNEKFAIVKIPDDLEVEDNTVFKVLLRASSANTYLNINAHIQIWTAVYDEENSYLSNTADIEYFVKKNEYKNPIEKIGIDHNIITAYEKNIGFIRDDNVNVKPNGNVVGKWDFTEKGSLSYVYWRGNVANYTEILSPGAIIRAVIKNIGEKPLKKVEILTSTSVDWGVGSEQDHLGGYINLEPGETKVTEGIISDDDEALQRKHFIIRLEKDIEKKGAFEFYFLRIDNDFGFNSNGFEIPLPEPESKNENRYIVTWGDSLTAMGGWTSKLEELTGLTVYNAGTGGESSTTIMARQGADVMQINNLTIPANGSVLIRSRQDSGGGIPTEFGNTVTPLLQGGLSHVNPVKIGDIEGTLAWTGENHADMDGTWTFTRSEDGDAVVIDRPTAIRTNYDRNRNEPYLMVIFMGQNGGYSDLDDLVRQHRLMIEHANAEHVIVLGLSSGTAAQRADYEERMRKEFGRYFISLREYLSTPIYTDGEITSCYGMADQNVEIDSDYTYGGKTTKQEIEEGTVPHQILADGVHYTDGTKTVIGNYIYKKCCELNIFPVSE